MNKLDLPSIGQPLNGGFFAGLINSDGAVIAIIVAPKAQGTGKFSWGKYGEEIEGANSSHNGQTNTAELVKHNNPMATWATQLNIAGFADWYIPSPDELETIYRNLKPTDQKNYCGWRDGVNPSAIELADRYDYTKELPAQTTVEIFQKDGSESLDPVWHWTSRQSSAGTAWGQNFGDGDQIILYKGIELAVRAVRRELVIQ
jgi:hypothetical protein